MKWYERPEEVYFHIICALVAVIFLILTWPMQPWTLHRRVQALEQKLLEAPEAPNGH